MRIALDVDDVLNIFLLCTIDEINRRYNKSYTVDDIKGWNMLDYIDITQDELYAIWTPEFVANIPFKSDAKWLIDKLKARCHEVVLATACWSPVMATREKKCVEELGINPEDIVFIKKKYILDVDVLVDDKLGNFYQEDGITPVKFEKIIMDMPHNRWVTNLGAHYRANDLEEVLDIIDIIDLIDDKNKK